MWIALLNVLLNPYGLLIFLLCFSGSNKSFFTPVGTNTVKLKIIPYLIFLVVYTGLVLGITYGISQFLPADFNIWEVYQPKYLWLSLIGWMVTIIIVKSYLSGMEGNVMGFIFFPMLVAATGALLLVNITTIFSFSGNIKLPELSQEYFWLGFAAHGFLPFQMLMTSKSLQDKENDEWSLPIITSVVFQMMIFVPHWIVVKIFGEGLTFYQYFGAGQSLLYYIPMLGGFFYFLINLFQAKSPEKKKLDGLGEICYHYFHCGAHIFAGI
ncbi:MAG: hypothetical protein KTR26_18800 [Flammeovirgaceae bacterium]|nr:hypothetical protein [Flammeovirgaceae bacterium]